MIVRIPEVLSTEEVAQICAAVDTAEFVDGKLTILAEAPSFSKKLGAYHRANALST